jgi:SAM-dependent methyltransferase
LEALPQSQGVGIDLSPGNIAEARRLQRVSPAGHRAEFVIGDYLTQSLGQFSLILSDSTLHLIPSDTEALFRKLAADLAPHGRLVFSMPYRCAHNAALSLTRRLLKRMRGRLTDRVILAIANRLHGAEMPPDLIAERLDYMYFHPHRYADRGLKSLLTRQCVLTEEPSLAYRHASPGQFKHSLNVFRKAG